MVVESTVTGVLSRRDVNRLAPRLDRTMKHRFAAPLATAFTVGLLLLGQVSTAPPAQAASISDLTPDEARLLR